MSSSKTFGRWLRGGERERSRDVGRVDRPAKRVEWDRMDHAEEILMDIIQLFVDLFLFKNNNSRSPCLAQHVHSCSFIITEIINCDVQQDDVRTLHTRLKEMNDANHIFRMHGTRFVQRGH